MFDREQKSYIIKTVKKDFKWDDIEKINIDRFCWRYDYKPTTYGQIVLVENEGFVVKMTCFEKNPKAVYKNFFEDVYKDSCMEFFACFDNKSTAYVNCEMNSLGASIMSIGKPDCERVPFDEILGHVPSVEPEINEDSWSVTLKLPLEDIYKLYGKINFEKGYKFTGNMFKCGDETEYEHYGMWCRSIAVIPQFHRVEYFGDLIIG
ncbi:MAG: hypothetical protein IJO86_04975 [Oscillospiraceae bacterium]|nr:hypothetical protein [Oscillospiraceae bacterium]